MSDLEQLSVLLKSHPEIGVLASLDIGGRTVAVAGAYEGETINFIQKHHMCYVHGFEPQDWAYAKCVERFANDPTVVLHNYGLGTNDTAEIRTLYDYGTDACSFVPDYKHEKSRGMGTLKNMAQVFADNCYKQGRLALAVFNMEGYEYDLIEHFQGGTPFLYTDYFLIQFHGVVDWAMRMQQSAEHLSRTHKRLWHKQMWELWAIR